MKEFNKKITVIYLGSNQRNLRITQEIQQRINSMKRKLSMKRSSNENVSSQKELGSNNICFPASRVTKQPSTKMKNTEPKAAINQRMPSEHWNMYQV